MRRSLYDLFIEDDIVCIIDRTSGLPLPSVTNDAENVIQDLVQKGLDVSKVIYRDTEGNWDILLTKENKFTGFTIGGTKEQAKLVVRKNAVVV